MRTYKTVGVAGVVSLILVTALAGCGGSGASGGGEAAGPPVAADAEQWRTIENDANAEGALTAYVSLTGMDPVFDDFRNAYPDIDVTVEQVPTADLLPRLDQEISVGAEGADVAFHASPGWFADNTQNFATLELGPAVQETGGVDRVGDQNYTGVYGFPNVISYRTTEAAPVNLEQLLDTNPDARIGIVDPRRSSPFVTYQYKVLQDAFGDDFMTRLSEANVTVVPSNPQLTEGIAAGDFDYAYPDIASITQAVIDKGAPVGIVVPEGPSVAGVHYNAAILENAAHTNAANVFMNWLMSAPGATSLARHLKPAVTPIDVEGSLPWDSVSVFDVDQWTSEAQNDWISENFAPNFG
ncbi:hypothetical protein CH280_17870 [Rhodococcus sp. 06-156-4C]|nr:hypothetical protein CH280_17870 [Rhodococcus sp. 06-156-4C]OZF65611.1 hypothetical protein CH290_09175 [Rhodococcus sp. 06-156-4]